ncbi:PEGA domain-containing protein [Sorangium sp. So ce406]|uniref:PEGA domain-containing protein n=1 Tax=Sorangium sp. So ce406 TaxID=3133311 RepID=UPI003F5C365B
MRSRRLATRLASAVALSALAPAAGAAAQPAASGPAQASPAAPAPAQASPAAPAPAQASPAAPAPAQASPAAPAPAQASPAAPAPAQASPAVEAPPAPLADTLTGKAKGDYELGKRLFGNGDFGNAFIKFQHAYESSKDVRLLWNMVVCTSRMHRYRQVLTLVEKLKQEDRGVLLPDDWARIADLERSARSAVGSLEFAVSERDAAVTIDGELIGKTPLSGKVTVDSGTRRIRVVKPGFKEHVRVERVSPGDELRLDVRLEPHVHAGRLSVLASPGDRIALDGKPVGQGRWDGAVPSGRHVLRVTAPGMVPYESEIVIQDEALSSVRVALTPVERTGGVPVWAWLTGATLLVAAAVAGGLLIKPEAAPPIEGTLGDTRPTAFGGRW